jgi:hypothetical protein
MPSRQTDVGIGEAEPESSVPPAIVTATEADLSYVVSLMRANRESVGGLPEPAVAERLERGTVLLAQANEDPIGYLLYDVRGDGIRIPQACIQYDARRRDYGIALVEQLLGMYPSAAQVSLRCAADLEANLFWRDLGFTCTGTVAGGTRRGRTINCWTRWLQPRLFGADAIAVPPAAEIRVDSRYDDSGFFDAAPDGFSSRVLPKLAWANR